MANCLILHIGSPKTGTTGVQNFLCDNESLLQEQGFSYPRIQEERYTRINASTLEYYPKGGIPDVKSSGWVGFGDTVIGGGLMV